MKYLKSISDFKSESLEKLKRFIGYHSSDSDFQKFSFDTIEYGSGSRNSTRIEGMFFSDSPQQSWGDTLYKVEILSRYPVNFDLSKSRFDSLGIQEAFDALFRGETSYLINDLLEYNDEYNEDYDLVEDLVEEWRKKCDLIIIENQVYASHKTEYIIPSPDYGLSPAIVNILEIIRK